MVNTFNDVNYLVIPKVNVIIEEIDDIKHATNTLPGTCNKDITNASVIAVANFVSFKSCISCRDEVNPVNSNHGCCTSCNILQHLDKCQLRLSAKLTIESNTFTFHLYAFGHILSEITLLPKDVTEEALLNASPFSLTYNHTCQPSRIFRDCPAN